MSEKPFIIPVFIPQAGCPYQCIFCNQKTITGHDGFPYWKSARVQAQQTVRDYLAYKTEGTLKTELAFYGGNFLGLAASQIEWYVDFACSLHQAGLIDALRFSTRPDTITPQSLSLLQNVPVSVIELGAQSMDDEVLRLSGRGHTAADTEQAVALIREWGFAAGLQIMPGLPGDTPERARATGQLAAELEPLCVRIYPTVVLKDSPLAQMYQEGRYQPLALDDAVDVTAGLYRLFRRQGIAVIRMGLQATDSLKPGETILAGPYHPAFGHLVISRLFWRALEPLTAEIMTNDVEIAVHTSQVSHARGLSNANVEFLKRRWPQRSFRFIADGGLAKTEVKVNGAIRDIIN